MTTISRCIMIHTPGRPSVAGRAFVFCAVAAMAMALTTSEPRATDGNRDVQVEERDGVYTVTAAFSVAAPPAVVVATLTDYEKIPEFMPDIRTSRVIERGEGGRTVVRQEAVAKMLLFSRRIQLELEIDERPGLITFRDRSGASFVRYEGQWQISARGTSSRVRYELIAKPTASVPEFLIRRLLGRDARQTIQLLTAEIGRRVQ